MKKPPTRLIFSFILCVTCWTIVLLPSCNLTSAQKATLEVNTIKDLNAAGLTYLTTGSGAAAALAAGAQVVKNHTPVTAAKQPVKVTP